MSTSCPTRRLPLMGTKVTIVHDNGDELTGRVIGYGQQYVAATEDAADWRDLPAGMTTVVLVELSRGFYSPDNTTFVSTLPVHPDNLRPAT